MLQIRNYEALCSLSTTLLAFTEVMGETCLCYNMASHSEIFRLEKVFSTYLLSVIQHVPSTEEVCDLF